jgi:hypothetical protein
MEEYQEWLYNLRGLTFGKVEAVGSGSDVWDLLVYRIDSDAASELRVVDKADFERLLAGFIERCQKRSGACSAVIITKNLRLPK